MIADAITDVPINKVGIEKGRTITALKIADLPRESAAPNAPNKLIKNVPSIKLKIIADTLSKGKYKTKAAIQEARSKGNPVISQCIKTLTKTNMKVGSREIKKLSKVPSLKSSLKIVSTASNEAKRAAIQITPGARELRSFC